MSTSTKVATALSSSAPREAVAAITGELDRGLDGAAPALVVVFASTAQPLEEIAPHVAAHYPSAVVIGASTAGEFTERGDAKSSVAAFAVAGDVKVFAGLGEGLRERTDAAVSAATAALPPSAEGYPYAASLVLLDPLAGSSELVALEISAQLGDDTAIAGGAAGDDLKMKATWVSLGGKVCRDAVVVARLFAKNPFGLGVAHGHEPLSEPLRVTKAEGATVHEIEGRPAWDVWLERTREHAKKSGIDVDRLADVEVGGFLLRYEAGLAAGDGYKIRAPLARHGGSIAFATEVPEGSIVRITQSEADAQVASAREAARRAREAVGDRAVKGALVFDCICRNLILGARFQQAVKGIGDEIGGAPLCGFETYGEIALSAGDLSGFHNTTSVVLVFT